MWSLKWLSRRHTISPLYRVRCCWRRLLPHRQETSHRTRRAKDQIQVSHRSHAGLLGIPRTHLPRSHNHHSPALARRALLWQFFGLLESPAHVPQISLVSASELFCQRRPSRGCLEYPAEFLLRPKRRVAFDQHPSPVPDANRTQSLLHSRIRPFPRREQFLAPPRVQNAPRACASAAGRFPESNCFRREAFAALAIRISPWRDWKSSPPLVPQRLAI